VSRPRMVLTAFAVCLAAVALLAPVAQATEPTKRPSHVVIIVLDQARPDTITRYGMKNVQKLQARGKNFPNAIVGHMAAETVISHNVLTSGLFPKHMGWTTEVYRDVGNVLGGGEGAFYVTSSMSCSQFRTLIQHGGYNKLQDYLDTRFPTGDFASISQKRTSACTSGWTQSMDAGDIIFQIRGSGSPMSCDGRSGWRQPEYVGPAGFFDLSTCSRWFTWQAAGAYGTGGLSPANIYPLDGDRFVPGRDPAHIGGDNWSADAAIRVIENNPNWRGMMVSLGGIDKLGHMWGPEDQGEPGAAPGSDAELRHLPFIAKNADLQVGRIVDALKRRGLRKDTLIVITADHAAQTGTPGSSFFGELAPGVTNPQCTPRTPPPAGRSTGIRSDCNWYLGTDADEYYDDPSPAVEALETALAGNLAFSYQDTHVGAWLKDNSLAKKQQAADAVLDMPDVIASYHLNAAQDAYVLFGTNPMSAADQSWFNSHAQALVDTMAAPNGPDVLGLVATNVTYGVVGDHGGFNRLVQDVPMVFSGPGVNPKDSDIELRHVDVVPTILQAMGIEFDPSDFDGEAVDLSEAKP
jgi:hypothetical protein